MFPAFQNYPSNESANVLPGGYTENEAITDMNMVCAVIPYY